MPKRTTEFQTLIKLVEQHLAPAGARVSGSRLLSDNRTGEDREVDIVIEAISGIHPVVIGIEVTETSRPATSPWIEGIAKKHEDLPIDKSIAVSRAGFYKPALTKASAYKIDALTLREATELDWKAKIDNIPSISIVSFLEPYLTGKFTVVTTEQSMLPTLKSFLSESTELYSSSGESRGSMQSIMERYISNAEVIRAIEKHAFTDGGTSVELQIGFGEGSYVLSPDSEKIEVYSIKFEALCNKELTNLDLKKGRYRDVAVTAGIGKTFGKPINVVFTERPDCDAPSAIFQVSKGRATD